LSHNAVQIIQRELWVLFTNRDYVILFFAFTVIVGILNGLLPLFNQMLGPHGYSNADAGTMAAVIIVVGLIGAIVGGVIMEKTRAYRTIMKVYVVTTGAVGLLFYTMMIPDNFWPLIVSAALLGFFALPILPIMMEVCAESTYPIPEEVSTGMLHNGANFFAVGVVFTVQALLRIEGPGPNPFMWSSMLVIALFLISSVLALMFNGRYIRSEHDVAHGSGSGSPASGDVDKLEANTLRKSLIDN
jgi:hypothetical protein